MSLHMSAWSEVQCVFYDGTSSATGVLSSGELLAGARLGLKAWPIPRVECLPYGCQDVMTGAVGASHKCVTLLWELA